MTFWTTSLFINHLSILDCIRKTYINCNWYIISTHTYGKDTEDTTIHCKTHKSLANKKKHNQVLQCLCLQSLVSIARATARWRWPQTQPHQENAPSQHDFRRSCNSNLFLETIMEELRNAYSFGFGRNTNNKNDSKLEMIIPSLLHSTSDN